MNPQAPTRSKLPLPPGPRMSQTPRWLNRFGRDILLSFDNMAATWGDVSALRLPGQTIVVVRGAEAAHRVLVANQDNYAKSPQYDLFRPVLGDGLVTSSGNTWKRSRRMVQPLFAKRHLGVYADHMALAAQTSIESWDANWKDGEAIELDKEILHAGLDTVGRALASHEFGQDGHVFEAAISGALQMIGEMSETAIAFIGQDVKRIGIVRAARMGTPRLWRRYLGHAQAADSVIASLVDERLQNGSGDRDDLLRLLIETTDEETGETLSRQQVIDEVKTFIAAGHETTAHGLTSMFLLLSENPEALARLHAELDSVLGGELPTADTAEQLEWLNACFLEAMRIYPPVWHIPRVAVEEDVVCGYRIPKGARVLVSVWSTHRDPSVYPDPTAFKPERWLGDAAKERPRFSYLPFGGGRRACVGQGFALLNASILGSMIAQRYDFERNFDHPVAFQPTITLRPSSGVSMFPRRRVLGEGVRTYA